MYKELDEVIAEDCTEDSWYDDGFLYARELLNGFVKKDWEEIFQQVNGKDNKWKVKLAYCIDDDMGTNGLNLLLEILNGNEEVAETVIDSLRSFNSAEYKKMIMSNIDVVSKAKELMDTASLPVKKMLEDFWKHLSEVN